MNVTLPPVVDPIGEALHSLRMSGTFYCRSEFTEPWALALPSMKNCLILSKGTPGGHWAVLFSKGTSRVANDRINNLYLCTSNRGCGLMAGLPAGVRSRWPELSYAIGAFALHAFLWRPAAKVAERLPWWIMPWPASQLAMELGPTLVLNAAALLGLGLALRIAGRFAWGSLAKTALLAAAFTYAAIALRIAAFGAPPPNSSWLLLLELPFFSFLMAAILGCRVGGAKRILA